MVDMLVDASYLVALGYPKDRNHAKAKTFAAEHETGLLIPDVVLVEAMYNLNRLGSVAATVTFSRLLIEQIPQFVALTSADFTRSVSLMDRYRDAELDFVDCCLTALAERLNIRHICTFDRRDFSMIRPKHTEYLQLMP
jgi:hypothetical protein